MLLPLGTAIFQVSVLNAEPRISCSTGSLCKGECCTVLSTSKGHLQRYEDARATASSQFVSRQNDPKTSGKF